MPRNHRGQTHAVDNTLEGVRNRCAPQAPDRLEAIIRARSSPQYVLPRLPRTAACTFERGAAATTVKFRRNAQVWPGTKIPRSIALQPRRALHEPRAKAGSSAAWSRRERETP
eukprot:5598971-Pyramimonas_sp.AAC.1